MNVVFFLLLFHLCHFASAVVLPAVRNAASAHRLVFVVFFAAAAVFVFFIEASHAQWHVSVNIAKFESVSSFSFQIFISSRLSLDGQNSSQASSRNARISSKRTPREPQIFRRIENRVWLESLVVKAERTEGTSLVQLTLDGQ